MGGLSFSSALHMSRNGYESIRSILSWALLMNLSEQANSQVWNLLLMNIDGVFWKIHPAEVGRMKEGARCGHWTEKQQHWWEGLKEQQGGSEG